MLRINDVVAYGEVKFRVLDVSDEGYVWINISSDKSFPEQVSLSDVKASILAETLKKIDDPYIYIATQLHEHGSVSQQVRDKRLAIIQDLIDNPSVYNRNERGVAIQKIVEKTGSPKKTIYAHLRRYWQRGCIPNALLPDYDNSGARGKKRSAGDNKLGRPRIIAPGTGANINEDIKRMFRLVLDRHYLTEKKHSLPYAHRRFEDMYAFVNPDVAKEDFPTLTQMRYFFEREYSLSDRIQKRTNKIVYQKDIRPLRSTATTNVHGPGARYEIDATTADIFLLSTDRTKIIGRPTFYAVIDVFSRLIVGFYIGLENPSYTTAMLALVNAIIDKTGLCRTYGYDITLEDWPSTGLPEAILADRGELLGHQIEYLEQSFGVRIENAPPYRGDAKGVVERVFHTIQADFLPFAPGVVSGPKERKRGGKDYRLNATLTVHEFTEYIIGSILYHNLYSVISRYDREPDMPDDLPAVPLRLWEWGIQNRSGLLRNVSETAVRIALLPRIKVTISDYGIQCFGAFYTCGELVESGWLHRTGHRRPGQIMAAYDPVRTEPIYVFIDPKKVDYWECFLTDRSRAYREKTMWELWDNQIQQKKTTAYAQLNEREKRRELEIRQKSIITNAEKLRPRSFGIVKKEVLSGIRENRLVALTEERKERMVASKPKGTKTAAAVIRFKDQSDEGAFPSFHEELFGDDD